MQTMRIFMISGKQKEKESGGRLVRGELRIVNAKECDRETELNRKKIIFGVRECVCCEHHLRHSFPC